MKSIYHVSIYEIDTETHFYKFLRDLDATFDDIEDANRYIRFFTRLINGANVRGYFISEELV